ncbi:ankyrin repeat protein [Arabidopsis thaliana]|uniref:Ankyrin repeat protein n=2 Tax=Arabidopsis thaliana TaxID=3702 RepID=A8MS11_ARATH|nr:ankyrin repeat protein [Arabidopsis thaliana]AEE35447.1 ankyrin repeat protein [Arabidopsis thaliana]|eukprot:NP_001077818.1 ankyrin repeat protein [Arabidopsis thaliana]
MAGREVKEYTNLSDPKDKKSGKGKIDDEDVTFQRMVAKMQEVAGERGGYLHGRGALDSDDLLYLKEQMEAEEDAERLLRRTEKRAFAAFKKAATQADSSPASIPLPLRVEPKPKSGIRQQDLLRKVVEVKPKRPKISTPSSPSLSPPVRSDRGPTEAKVHRDKQKEEAMPVLKKPGADRNDGKATESNGQGQNAPKGLLGLAYDSSDEED